MSDNNHLSMSPPAVTLPAIDNHMEVLTRALQIYLDWARTVPEIMERVESKRKEKSEG
jgi:hypothetical protein